MFFFHMLNLLVIFPVNNDWVYTPNGSQKTKKNIVYTPMVGSQKICVMVYAQFGGSS